MRGLDRRRAVAALGLLVPGGLTAALSVYVVLAGGDQCTSSTPAHAGSCASNGGGVAVATFPIALVCIVVGAGVLRGAHWTRWPAVILGAVLATVIAAGALAGVTAMGGDGSDVRGAITVGIGGVVLAALCALPPLLLSGARGERAFPARPTST